MLRAKQEAERLAAQARENEARAHQLAQHHQGILSEVEKHTHTLTQARTDAEKHMQRACLLGLAVLSAYGLRKYRCVRPPLHEGLEIVNHQQSTNFYGF